MTNTDQKKRKEKKREKEGDVKQINNKHLK
jgi:hypothetical protein